MSSHYMKRKSIKNTGLFFREKGTLLAEYVLTSMCTLDKSVLEELNITSFKADIILTKDNCGVYNYGRYFGTFYP